MSEQETVITKKKSKEQLWKEILEKLREALSINAENKKKLIQLGAKTLEEKEMPLYQICGAMTKELKGFASGQYIRECLDDKYKNLVMKREQQHEEIAQVSSANDSNNVIEQEPIITRASHDVPLSEQTVVQQQPQQVDETIEQVPTVPIQEQQEELEAEEETFHIRPEDYDINDLHKYSSEFKDRIIIHLDEEITRLKQVLEGVKE